MQRYEPASEFLRMVINEEAPLEGSEQAEANLQRLVGMLQDEDVSNRDWAALLLSQHSDNTVEIRNALAYASNDENEYVRAEAILGLARRDRSLALPLIRKELKRDFVPLAVFEAASIAADPSLIDLLREYTATVGDAFVDDMVWEALRACGDNGD